MLTSSLSKEAHQHPRWKRGLTRERISIRVFSSWLKSFRWGLPRTIKGLVKVRRGRYLRVLLKKQVSIMPHSPSPHLRTLLTRWTLTASAIQTAQPPCKTSTIPPTLTSPIGTLHSPNSSRTLSVVTAEHASLSALPQSLHNLSKAWAPSNSGKVHGKWRIALSQILLKARVKRRRSSCWLLSMRGD